MPRSCWILGAGEEQVSEMLPETVSMGFPLIGDLSRFGYVAAVTDAESDDLEVERERRRALVAEFRLVYPGVLEEREHPARRLADPFGLWLFCSKTQPRDLVVIHVGRGENREAAAVAEVVGPYFFLGSSPWPHRLPVMELNRDRWKLPSPYSGWGGLFARSAEDNRLLAMVETLTGRELIDRQTDC